MILLNGSILDMPPPVSLDLDIPQKAVGLFARPSQKKARSTFSPSSSSLEI